MSQKVLKKEIITITTTKIYYLNGREIAKRTKTKNSESNTTIMMCPAELERKTIKPTNRNAIFFIQNHDFFVRKDLTRKK